MAAGIYGTTQLDIDFSLDTFFTIKEGSYQDEFLEAEKLFKTQERAAILLGNLDYSSQMDKITSLVDDLDALESVDLSMQKALVPLLSSAANLSDFLATPEGQAFAPFFNISEETKEIQASMIPFKYLTPHTTSEGMALMDEIDAIVEAQVLAPFFFVFSDYHLNPAIRALMAESLCGFCLSQGEGALCTT